MESTSGVHEFCFYFVIGLEKSIYLLKFQSKLGLLRFPALELRFRQFVPC